MKKWLWIIAGLGTLFQIGHFAEHATQAGMWLFADHTKPWMSGLASWLSMAFADLVWGARCIQSIAMARGMEILHLIGNTIFLVTLATWMYLRPDNAIKRGFAVELFHLSEHINLTVSVVTLGKAIGWSTLFGYAPQFFGHDGAVGFRVLWHFSMNLIPTAFMAYSMWEGGGVGWRGSSLYSATRGVAE